MKSTIQTPSPMSISPKPYSPPRLERLGKWGYVTAACSIPPCIIRLSLPPELR